MEMRGVAKVRPAPGVELVAVPRSQPGPGEVLVQVAACGICGTDLSYLQWREYVRDLITLPRILGHEFVGRVVAAGPGASTPVGARITADSDGGCGACHWCRRGLPNACLHQVRLGCHRDGGLAEYVVVPERSAYVVPDSVDDKVACLLEPFAAAVHAVEQLPNLAGSTAAVIGPGPVGILAGVALQDAGALPVLLMGLDEDAHRLAVARELGLDAGAQPAVAEQAAGLPGGGVDVVVDAVGSAATLATALELVCFGGHISIVGIGAPGDIAPARIVAKEAHLHGSWRRVPRSWDRVMAIAARRPDLALLVDGVYALEDAEQAFEALEQRKHVKTVLAVAAS
jgi:threonine dehydrogenase-like Zn-dependent dehydrogenase